MSRADLSHYTPFSQSEAAGKGWFRPCSSRCRLKLQSCAIRNDMEEFWVVVENVRKRGNYIDEETFLVIESKLIKLDRVDDAKELKLFFLSKIDS